MVASFEIGLGIRLRRKEGWCRRASHGADRIRSGWRNGPLHRAGRDAVAGSRSLKAGLAWRRKRRRAMTDGVGTCVQRSEIADVVRLGHLML